MSILTSYSSTITTNSTTNSSIASEVDVNVNYEPRIVAVDDAIASLAAIEGSLDLYCWYEGPQGLPKSGAIAMKAIFEKLLMQRGEKKTTLCLYSLSAWKFTTSNTLLEPSKLTEKIKTINNEAIRSLSSISFFKYCQNEKAYSPIEKFAREELPTKQWLLDLSKNMSLQKKKVRCIVKKNSLLKAFLDYNVAQAYSFMQYLEGYFLVRESIRRGLERRQDNIQIAFLLPNDEYKYYVDFPSDVKKLLTEEFKENLIGKKVGITFKFFEYKGKNGNDRPYNDNKSEKVKECECNYFLTFNFRERK